MDEPAEGPNRRLLESIDRRLASIDQHLRELNGKVATHHHELFGAEGRGGLVDDVQALWLSARPSREATTRVMWAAVSALAAVAGVTIALIVGLR
jgi:hypothetical protein